MSASKNNNNSNGSNNSKVSMMRAPTLNNVREDDIFIDDDSSSHISPSSSSITLSFDEMGSTNSLSKTNSNSQEQQEQQQNHDWNSPSNQTHNQQQKVYHHKPHKQQHHHRHHHLQNNMEDATTIIGSTTPHKSFRSPHRFRSSRPRRRSGITTSSSNGSIHHSSNADKQYWRHHPNSDSSSSSSTNNNNNNNNNNNSASRHFRRRSSSSALLMAGDQPPLPSIWAIATELIIVCSLYCRYTARSLRKPLHKMKRICCLAVTSVVGVVLLLTAWLIFDFYRDASQVCTPPPIDQSYINTQYERPLVEYYVHGRGMGHYSRSLVIVEKLNQAGIDVRMFLSRSAMWRAMHEDTTISENLNATTTSSSTSAATRGSTTAISVASITPDMDLFSSISHTMERIVGDCEVAAQYNRYPLLVISDGDMPGMLRAKIGGIPSVGIAHGQLFNIAQKPSWVASDDTLNRGWNKQGRLNGFSSLFSEWQIATHFCRLESKVESGEVAQAPLRPEVIEMAKSRTKSQQGIPPKHIPQEESVKTTLLLLNDNNKNINATAKAQAIVKQRRRKLVICYFRDRNGEQVTDALLAAGFDVLVFDNSFAKESVKDESRYGAKWIVTDRFKHREIQHIDGSGNNNRNIAEESNGHERRKLAEPVTTAITASTNAAKNSNNDSDNLIDPPRLIRVLDRSLFVPLMYVADGVASSAGSQLMSECIYSDMPLFALYLEKDDEQRLNVELAQKTTTCKRPQVFGTSFENVKTININNGDNKKRSMRNNKSSSSSSSKSSRGTVAQKELDSFVEAVRSSSVSASYFQKFGLETVTNNNDLEEKLTQPKQKHEQHHHQGRQEPFKGLPDAADIILEIVKQVQEAAGQS